jgi:tellurium resistance protein TerD
MSDVLNLTKGESINLTKEVPTLKKIIAGAGWDASNDQDVDLDLMVFALGENGRARTKDDVIYFGNLKNEASTMVHMGDNLTGEGEGDDEQVVIDLENLDEGIKSVVIALVFYKPGTRDLSIVENAFVRVVDQTTNNEIARTDIKEDMTGKLSIVLAELVRVEGGFEMKAIDEASSDDIGKLTARYHG